MSEELLALRQKALVYARFKGYRDLAEDFAQDVVLKALEGRTTRMDFSLIDYLRKESTYRAYRRLYAARYASMSASLADTVDCSYRWQNWLPRLSQKERSVAEMVWDKGASLTETAKAAEVTVPAVSMMVSKLRGKFHRAYYRD